MKNKKWYVEQQVWDKTVSYEAGIVHNINFSPDFPVVVIFGDVNEKINAKYSIEGALEGSILITLSTKPYEIIMEGFSQEVEEELPYKGQVCWGKGEYLKGFHVGHFIEKIDGIYKLSSSNDIEEGFFSCNEITTKNPYAVEEEVSKMETTDREPKVGDMVFAWDDKNRRCVCTGILTDFGVSINPDYKYRVDGKNWKYCSLKNPLIK